MDTEIEQLKARVAELESELRIAQTSAAFGRLAVQERDYERTVNEDLRREVDGLAILVEQYSGGVYRRVSPPVR